jgi:hypothetical protein
MLYNPIQEQNKHQHVNVLNIILYLLSREAEGLGPVKPGNQQTPVVWKGANSYRSF